jgi:hypothetical protein
MSGFPLSQFASLPYPSQPFDGQTIIVTGANTGLGLEAGRSQREKKQHGQSKKPQDGKGFARFGKSI